MQYLDFGGFDKTLQDFERECEQKGKPIADVDVKSRSNQKLIGIQVSQRRLERSVLAHCSKYMYKIPNLSPKLT